MRCFISIEMPVDIKRKIGGIIEDVREHVGYKSKGIRWVPPQNIHLTLKFLGGARDNLIPEIEKGLSLTCMNHSQFNINIRGVDVFPSSKYPSVLWIGIDESDELKRLYLDIEESMSELGIEKESRRFSPHLTIGRIKDKNDIEPALKELYVFKDTFFGNIEVMEILLMKSILRSTGAKHLKVSVFKLSEKSLT
ncbi:MAG: RNA 2',3'-cyclic phosphodiesterase [Thermodesulfovibrionales bacterium]|nr:RNA 2',3'-cyclic phosphodiesterase [Thermodesulfovibrionales bacterium]